MTTQRDYAEAKRELRLVSSTEDPALCALVIKLPINVVRLEKYLDPLSPSATFTRVIWSREISTPGASALFATQ